MTDTDDDQLPDYWELQYGRNPWVAEPGDRDSDADGSSDHEEYIHKTDPTDSGSVFRLEIELIESLVGGKFFVLCNARKGLSYELQRSSTMEGGSWISGSPWVQANGDLVYFTDIPGQGPASFFRVRALLPSGVQVSPPAGPTDF